MGPTGDVLARKRLLDLVWRYPGLHMRQLQRLAGLDLSLVEYHLNRLEETGVVLSTTQGGYRRFFPLSSAESLGHDDRRVLGLLRQDAAFAVVLLLLDRGTALHKEIAAELGVSKPALSYHLRKLADAGVLVKVPRGGERGFRLADPERVLRLLRSYRPTPDLVSEYARLWASVYDRLGPEPQRDEPPE